MRETQDEFDSLLDLSLCSYADPGPESGIEQRVLERLAAERARASRRRRLVWAVVLPVAACLALAVVLGGTGLIHLPSGHKQRARRSKEPAVAESHTMQQQATRSAPARPAEAAAHKQQARRTVPATKSTPLPKQEVFPMPRPLSPEEQALVNFAAHATKSERESLLKTKEGLNAPIHFAEVHIEPLELPGEGSNN